MASVPTLTKTGGYRPPILPPIGTTFAPVPDDFDQTGLYRLEQRARDLEELIASEDVPPELLYDLASALRDTLNRQLEMIRLFMEAKLPPQMMASYGSPNLESVSSTERRYIELANRVQRMREKIEDQLALQRLLDRG